jgi:transcriptional regulator with XRE-family HTH domain
MGPQSRRTSVTEGGPDQIDVEVGLNLRRMRLARGFSQTELGNALGVSFQQIQKYERGSNRLSASMLVKAARFLAIPSADLLPLDDQVRPLPNFVHRFAEVRGVPELVDGYCTLRNPALRSVLLQLLKAMNGKHGPEAKPMADEAAASRPQ